MRTRRAWLAVPWLLLGCGQVLGIEDAHVDPALESSGGSSVASGSAAGSAGASVAAASGGGMAADAGSAPTAAAGAAGESSDAGSGGAGGKGGGGAAGAASLCDRYCAAVTSGCTDKHTQYLDLEACLAICPLLPEGIPGDTSGNTINCRLTYAQKASSEPYTYCTWAGPGGDGKCGSNCDGFCTVMMQECTESAVAGDDTFASPSSCMTACGALKDVGNYSATDSALQMGADHVQCRLYHVNAAVSEDDPTTHCPHAVGKTLCHAP